MMSYEKHANPNMGCNNALQMCVLHRCDTQFVQTPPCLTNGTTMYFTQPITADISAVSSS
jgi:hypothetical protein